MVMHRTYEDHKAHSSVHGKVDRRPVYRFVHMSRYDVAERVHIARTWYACMYKVDATE